MSVETSKNRLKGETSPYLLQHAQNPVDWHPWGQEALDKARKEGKPIFLSIGYSACHWCHVMAHESFENPDIARLMNDDFINIKVDREERPDLDTVYMNSVIAMTGQGGWPLSVFLTPDLKPYFGGTYFPPTSMYGSPGFQQVLREAHDLYHTQKDQVLSRFDKVAERLNPAPTSQSTVADAQMIDEAISHLAEKFDDICGGFGQGMKFPDPVLYRLLLNHWLRTGSSQSMDMLDKSLTKMAEGGMFDQLGGGFHRYSTDPQWLVPHFEKMLSDNALLAKLYLDVFQATKQDIYKAVPQEIFAYVLREMTSEEGGFYSSQDADSQGEEGRFYVWDMKEVLDLLGPRNARVFARAFGISPTGNWGRKNILHVRESMDGISEQENIPIFEVHHILKTGKSLLFSARQKRQNPVRDDKILTSWNGMMISAFAAGYSILRDKTYLQAATRCGELLWNRLWQGDRLLRVYKDGQAKVEGFLDDYASLLEAYMELYSASFDLVWVERAIPLADKMIELFWDGQDGGFFMTENRHDKLFYRPKPGVDDAMPASNAIAAWSLARLGHLTGKKEYVRKSEETVRAFHSQIQAQPLAHMGFLSVIELLAKPPVEIVLAGTGHGPVFEEILCVVHQDYRPRKALIHASVEGAEKLLPLAEGKTANKDEPTVYLCQNMSCHAPVHSAIALQNILEKPPLIKLNLFDEDKYVTEKTAEETTNFLNAMAHIFKHSGLGKK